MIFDQYFPIVLTRDAEKCQPNSPDLQQLGKARRGGTETEPAFLDRYRGSPSGTSSILPLDPWPFMYARLNHVHMLSLNESLLKSGGEPVIVIEQTNTAHFVLLGPGMSLWMSIRQAAVSEEAVAGSRCWLRKVIDKHGRWMVGKRLISRWRTTIRVRLSPRNFHFSLIAFRPRIRM